MMKKVLIFSLCGCIALSVSGCSTVKRLTGVRDDTVLPGERENVLPADQQTWSDPNVKRNQTETQAAAQTPAQAQNQTQTQTQSQIKNQPLTPKQPPQPCKLNDTDCEPAGAYEPGKASQ